MKALKKMGFIGVPSICAVALLTFACFNQPKTYSYRQVPASLIAAQPVAPTDLSQATISAAFDLTASLPAGYKKDGTVDYTQYLQKAIDAHQNVTFPDFPVLVNTNGLIIKSNKTLIFKNNSKIILQANALPSYAILKISDAQNISIYSPNIAGDRDNHQGTTGEGGMGIKIYGSKNINIYNPVITKCWGDAIYLANTAQNVNGNINILNARLDYNRRNGISVTGGENINILNPVVSNTFGTPPMAGIDIEPNNNKAVVDNITLKNYISFNNGTSCFQIGMSKLQGVDAKNLNVVASNIRSIDSPYGIIIGGFFDRPNNKKVSGAINISDVEIVNANMPVKIGQNNQNGPTVSLRKFRLLTKDLAGKESNQDSEMKTLRSRIQKRLNISIE